MKLYTKIASFTLAFLLIFITFGVFSQKKVDPEAKRQAAFLIAMFSENGLFGEIKPSLSSVQDEIDFRPLPESVNQTDLKKSLALFAKAFYLSKAFDNARVEIDKFILPNADKMDLALNWDSVKTVSGKDVMDRAAERRPYSSFSSYDDIPIKDFDEADPLFEAKGKAVVKVPVQFIHLEIEAGKLNQPVVKGDYEAELILSKNDMYKLKVKNLKKQNISEAGIFIIPLGKNGRLKMTEQNEKPSDLKMPEFIKKAIADLENGRMATTELEPLMEKHKAEYEALGISNSRTFSGKVQGTIKKLIVSIPGEFLKETIEVTATTEPDTNSENPGQIRSARYLDRPKIELGNYSLEELKNKIKVYSSRSNAMFGYNTPEVVCLLPDVANSEYSSVEFIEPKLFSQQMKPVLFELETGGYSSEKHSAEIRFRPRSGDAIVNYAHAKGKIHIKYPLKIKTISVKKSSSVNEAGVAINGRFVKFNREKVIDSANSFAKINPVRAFDGTGRELYKLNYSGYVSDENGDFTTLAFWGEPETVEVDVALDWAEFDLIYNLPPAKMLPKAN